jgi:hypothetical protein
LSVGKGLLQVRVTHTSTFASRQKDS